MHDEYFIVGGLARVYPLEGIKTCILLLHRQRHCATEIQCVSSILCVAFSHVPTNPYTIADTSPHMYNNIPSTHTHAHTHTHTRTHTHTHTHTHTRTHTHTHTRTHTHTHTHTQIHVIHGVLSSSGAIHSQDT